MSAPLKPDEARCNKCSRVFVSGEAFIAHEGPYARCKNPTTVGLVPDRRGVWMFKGKDHTHKPRRSQAQAAFDRVVSGLSVTKQRSLATDIEKVQRALEKERDRT